MRALFGGDLMLRSVSGTARFNTSTLTLTFYDAATGGAQVTDLLAADGVTAATTVEVTGSTVPAFYGPDGVVKLWADAGDGTRELMRGSYETAGGLSPEDAAATYAPRTEVPKVLDAVYYNPASGVNPKTTSTTAVAIDSTNLAVTFTAPADGIAIVNMEVTAWQNLTGSNYMTLIDAATTAEVPGAAQLVAQYPNARSRIGYTAYLTGLTPGQTYTYRAAFKAAGGGESNVQYGSTAGMFGPFVMEVWSRPLA